jgi:hypothetical protein
MKISHMFRSFAVIVLREKENGVCSHSGNRRDWKKNIYNDWDCVLCEVRAEAVERVEHRVTNVSDCKSRRSIFEKYEFKSPRLRYFTDGRF